MAGTPSVHRRGHHTPLLFSADQAVEERANRHGLATHPGENVPEKGRVSTGFKFVDWRSLGLR